MPTEKKARELADKFDKAYPGTLPERLRWWGQVLGVDCCRFLRLMGMSPQQAEQNKGRDWEEILQDRDWEERGWWLEGQLHRAVATFNYDWEALAEHLHQPRAGNGHAQPVRIPPPTGKAIPLHQGPNDHDGEFLLNLLAGGGGPGAFRTAGVS